MSAAFVVTICRQCGHATYPPRALCPVCAANMWQRRLADTGVVEETTVRRPVDKHRQLPWGNWTDQTATPLASVRTDLGPIVIARLPHEVVVGTRVRLTAKASTAIALPGHDAVATPIDDGLHAASVLASREDQPMSTPRKS